VILEAVPWHRGHPQPGAGGGENGLVCHLVRHSPGYVRIASGARSRLL
jgi:hypothetical protein